MQGLINGLCLQVNKKGGIKQVIFIYLLSFVFFSEYKNCLSANCVLDYYSLKRKSKSEESYKSNDQAKCQIKTDDGTVISKNSEI